MCHENTLIRQRIKISFQWYTIWGSLDRGWWRYVSNKFRGEKIGEVSHCRLFWAIILLFRHLLTISWCVYAMTSLICTLSTHLESETQFIMNYLLFLFKTLELHYSLNGFLINICHIIYYWKAMNGLSPMGYQAEQDSHAFIFYLFFTL